MKRILCYGDSNTWGYIPGSGARFAPTSRWTGILQVKMGNEALIVEQGLNGRTTAWDDPTQPGRNGAETLPSILEEHRPLDLVVTMLGTNDMKYIFGRTASEIAQGMQALVMLIKASKVGPLAQAPQILLVSPPRIRLLPFLGYPVFRGALQKSKELSGLYGEIARRCHCHFLNATAISAASLIDGVHLDEVGHRKLGDAMAMKLAWIFNQNMILNRDQ